MTGDRPTVLTDQVVLLRPWRADDAEWYAAAARDPEIQRYTSEPASLTAGQVRAAFAALADRPDATGFAIADAATGELLGNLGLRRDTGAGAGEVSYWVTAAARGQGVASRAVRLISDWALTAGGLSEVRLWTHSGNAASGRVAEHAGYRRAPEHDQPRTVKGELWPTTAYRRRAPAVRSRPAGVCPAAT